VTGPNARPATVPAAVDDPQRRFRLASERSAELGRERAALTEIRDGLEIDEHGLRADISAAEAECLELEAKLDATKNRADELESEIAASDRNCEELARELVSVRNQV
jgi:chromosome segregation ATPase